MCGDLVRMRFRYISRRANLCKKADPYPAKNETDTAHGAKWIPKVNIRKSENGKNR